MNEIEAYLETVLYPQLKAAGMPYRFNKRIQDDIRNRMLSCLEFWGREEERRAILFFSLEEALFYEPAAKENVREFVVTTVRNSMLELAASVNCRSVKLPEPLSNEQIRGITSEAVRFFDGVNWEALAETVSGPEMNVYSSAMEKYPLAWRTAKSLANLTGQEMDMEAQLDSDTGERASYENAENLQAVICDGFTLEFDEELRRTLGEVVSGAISCFYSDCFKTVSRNFEKVLHVLQILLENRCVFCTCNYFISRDHLEKRKKILRAAHSTKEMLQNMQKENAPKMIRMYIDQMMGDVLEP